MKSSDQPWNSDKKVFLSQMMFVRQINSLICSFVVLWSCLGLFEFSFSASCSDYFCFQRSGLSFTLLSHFHKGSPWCRNLTPGSLFAGRNWSDGRQTERLLHFHTDVSKVKPRLVQQKQSSHSRLAQWFSVCSLTYKLFAESTSWFKKHKDCCWGKHKALWVLEHITSTQTLKYNKNVHFTKVISELLFEEKTLAASI